MASLAAAEEAAGPALLGVGLALRDAPAGRVVIAAVAAGSAAGASGLLREGDEVRGVDHAGVAGLGWAAGVAARLVGPAGSVVVLTVARPGEPGVTHATLVRRGSAGEREDAAQRRKEVYDVGLALAVGARGEVRPGPTRPVPCARHVTVA